MGLFYNAPEPTPDTGGQCVNVPRIDMDMMVDDMLLELTQSLSYYHGVCSLLAAVRVCSVNSGISSHIQNTRTTTGDLHTRHLQHQNTASLHHQSSNNNNNDLDGNKLPR